MGTPQLPRPPSRCQLCGEWFMYNASAVPLKWHVDVHGRCLLYYWVCLRCYDQLPARLQGLASRLPPWRKGATSPEHREVFVSFGLDPARGASR